MHIPAFRAPAVGATWESFPSVVQFQLAPQKLPTQSKQISLTLTFHLKASLRALLGISLLRGKLALALTLLRDDGLRLEGKAFWVAGT